MSNVIRLSDHELKRIENIKNLYSDLEKLNKEQWALMGLGDYVSYNDLDDIHDFLNMILHDVSIAVQRRIVNVTDLNQIITRDLKKES